MINTRSNCTIGTGICIYTASSPCKNNKLIEAIKKNRHKTSLF